ncbi:unnamed protein product [Toxocara canis]|uniref:Phosphopyruvate hydratase n=1 Tax=Toxocara canis TaxID=6265 RepID=A0A183U0T9_TOXCA|nr:unnamed protein product [Toxocara canis]
MMFKVHGEDSPGIDNAGEAVACIAGETDHPDDIHRLNAKRDDQPTAGESQGGVGLMINKFRSAACTTACIRQLME